MTRIIHISDLHFSKITLNPLQFFSKRWIGNTNLIFSRRNTYIRKHLDKLPALAKEMGVDLVLFSGDASTTGRRDELLEAKNYLQGFGIKTLSVPGNHDHYTRKDYAQRSFYQALGNAPKGPFSLQKDKVEIGSIGGKWHYLLLDTVIATPIYSSQGYFSEELADKIKLALKEIPKDARILMLNHFPFFQFDNPRKRLKNGHALLELLKTDPRIQIYAHGHTHLHCIADLREDGLPIILDSGSTAHHKMGSFNIYDLSDDKLEIDIYKIKQEKWSKVGNTHFEWS